MSKTPQTELNSKNNTDIVTYKLTTPTTIDGVEYENITLDFHSLSGDDIINAEFEMLASGGTVAGPAELNKTYLMYISARAAKITFEKLKKFSIRDVTKITLATQNFLMHE